jgi:VWFA-related protein
MTNLNNTAKKALLCFSAATALAAFAVVPRVSAAESVTLTVTAVGRKNAPPPPIKKEDVEVFQGKERMQVADWKRGETLFIAILIDDSLDQGVASQWNDVRAFINAQSPNTYVSVAYSRNGSAMVAQDFTNDHALAAKALRIPLGGGGAFSSPYLALQDWIQRWPDNGGDRRSIIMVSSGVDYFRGGFDPIDPDLDTTVERAQKKNINLWTIYYPDAFHAGTRFFRAFNAQSNLSRISEETGAESYYLGTGRPVAFKPYLDEIQNHLKNQYLLTFDGPPGGKKGKFERIRVATEIPKVEFTTPSEVFLPASQ